MKSNFRFLLAFVLLALSCSSLPAAPQDSSAPESIVINVRAQGQPFPHYWEQMFGSGRAILSLRDSYRRDLREVKSVTGFQFVRFHGIFMDEVGVYNEDPSGHPIYNFSYVDQIYDGLLKDGVRPFVELSFMPKKLAAADDLQPFWYHPNVAPPKDYALWGDLVAQFARHLVARYGIDEVSRWYFEVWNEPNIDFWQGSPKQQTYYQLYDSAARALKTVSPRLRVGGPATAQAAWVGQFIAHTQQDHVPVDFVSTHVYGNDSAQDVFGTHEDIPRSEMVCRAVQKVHAEIQSSALPHIPLIWSEFNASYKNEPDVTDTVYMGPWLANTIRQCDGLVDMMSYWTFSDVFEEQGVVKTPFYGGFGLIAEDDLPKPSFNAFRLLHRLGDVRIPASTADALATRRPDGSLEIAVWNLRTPGADQGSKDVTVHLKSFAGPARATVYLLDADHGSLLKAYAAMGSPATPTPAQIKTLRAAAALPAPAHLPLKNSSLSLHLAPNALALIEIPNPPSAPHQSKSP